MPELVQHQETIHLPHSRQAIWPILSKTDWVNRAIGLPAVAYEMQPRPEGGTTITARAKAFGLKLVWQELPFEWTEPKFYQVRRIFQGGPLAEALLGVRLQETKDGCAVQVFGDFLPRQAFGTFFAKRVIGPKALHDMRGLVGHIGEHLAGQKKAVLPRLPVTPPSQAALAAALKKLRADKLPEELVTRLTDFLREAPDVELSHLRPFTIARFWRADRWEVLRLFLHATRAGLLNFSWEILCPNCRSTRLPRTMSLAGISRGAHCDVCNIRYDAEFDKSVELKFAVHPAVRPCDEQTFCLAGPGGKPHIVSQRVLGPGESGLWDWPENSRAYELHSLQVKTPVALPLPENPGEPPSDRAEIVCHPEQFEIHGQPGKTNTKQVQVRNPNPFPVQLSLEATVWDEDILTAARVTNWQEFRDLFTTEVISPTEQVTVGSQVILFTDLRSSTALYRQLGDAPAYVLVRDHFKILHDVVAWHHGAVVKTIGDAIMAVFSDLPTALATVRAMHVQMAANLKGGRLQLKSAVHAGPCLAVNANDRLDFFGTTVNLAARLVEHSQGGDLVLADELYQRAETQQFLTEIGQQGTAGEKKFSGFEAPLQVWRIPMQ